MGLGIPVQGRLTLNPEPETMLREMMLVTADMCACCSLLLVFRCRGVRLARKREAVLASACSFKESSYATSASQRVHVGIWSILRAQRGSHIPTLRPKYIPYTYMDPLGLVLRASSSTLRGPRTKGAAKKKNVNVCVPGPQKYVK